ncbi:MAG: hypothetical protein ACI80P_001661 [Flavobacteriales bacterium]|jgi:hypothetical protein
MRRSLIVLFLLTINFIASAQSIKQWLSLGEEAEANQEYAAAAQYYGEAYALDSLTFEITVSYANAMRLTRNYSKAEALYDRAYDKDKGRLYPKGQFYLAQMQKINGEYSKALRNFKKYSKRVKRDKDGYEYKKSIQEVKACEFAINARRNDSQISIAELDGDVNTSEGEFAPLYKDSALYFTSNRPDFAPYLANQSDSSFFLDATYDPIWHKPGIPSGDLVFSPNGDYAYFVECPDSTCRIMEAEVVDGVIKAPSSISIINKSGYNCTTPWIGVHGGQEVLLYASNRPGTRGGMDIWWSFRQPNGDWQAPANAGDNVNTADDELAPFFDGKHLYFSSTWHEGFGGFDVFRSKGYPRSFDLPENLGYPINSSYNDIYYRYFPEAGGAFLASNRSAADEPNNFCCTDLFFVQYKDSLRTEEKDVYATLEELNTYLPVTLYFHNDEPNPNSRDTTTQRSYEDCFASYQKLRPTYLRENGKGLKGETKEESEFDVEDFYTFFVEKGFNDLALFSDLLLKELEKGYSINLTIKGFASPRAKSDYNVNLTRRRIASLVNSMNDAQEGAFRSYVNGTAKNHATLSFTEVPFGEYEANQSVSDAIEDEQESIFSRGARLERKIEIQSVQKGMPDSLFVASSFNELVHDFGTISKNSPISTTFVLTNSGTDTIRIDSIASSCSCTVPVLTSNKLAPGESTEINVQFDPSGLNGIISRKVTLFLEGQEDPLELTITSDVE